MIDGSVIGTGSTPSSRISAPEFIDWHMILDRELEQLSRPEIGLLSSIGFTALGVSLGLLPGFVSSLGKSKANTFDSGDATTLIVFVASTVGAVICLVIAGVGWYRNKGLADEIRRRPKHGASQKQEDVSRGSSVRAS
jgi:hypothetical protein